MTNRRDGNVGRPRSVAPPSASETPLDGAEGALGGGGGGRRRQGEPGPQAVVAARVVEAGGDPHQALAGPQLEAGRHLHRPRPGAHPSPLQPLGPVEGADDAEAGPEGAVLVDVDGDRGGGVDGDVAVGGRVVVGVARVGVVDEEVEAAPAVDGEGAVAAVDGDGDEAVGQGEPVVGGTGGDDGSDGRRRVGGRPGPPSEAGHVVGPDEDPPVGLVLDADVDRVAAAGAGPGVEVGDGGGEDRVGRRAAGGRCGGPRRARIRRRPRRRRRWRRPTPPPRWPPGRGGSRVGRR